MESTIFETIPNLDHVAICSRSLSEAKNIYSSHLGFQLFPEGKHEQYGTKNSGAWFSDNTYLELLTYFDEIKAGWLVEFLKAHEGAMFFALKTTSLDKVAQSLRQEGIDVEDPIPGTILHEGQKKAPPEMWRTLFLPTSLAPGRVLFFIEYSDHGSSSSPHPFAQYRHHPNTASRLRSVWVAVKGFFQAEEDYQAFGFPVGPEHEVIHMEAARREILLSEETTIDLLRPLQDTSLVHHFLEVRGEDEGVVGLTIEVAEMERAKQAMSPEMLAVSTEIQEDNKLSLLIPPEVSKGVWIELRQQGREPGKDVV